jgi:hypothetical protein
MCDIMLCYTPGNDACHLPSMRQGTIGKHAHQAHVASPVNKLDPLFRHYPAQVTGMLAVNRVPSAAGSAKDTNSFHPEMFRCGTKVKKYIQRSAPCANKSKFMDSIERIRLFLQHGINPTK